MILYLFDPDPGSGMKNLDPGETSRIRNTCVMRNYIVIVFLSLTYFTEGLLLTGTVVGELKLTISGVFQYKFLVCRACKKLEESPDLRGCVSLLVPQGIAHHWAGEQEQVSPYLSSSVADP